MTQGQVFSAGGADRRTVRVAAAVIFREGRILATQRGYGPFRDGWEFPGGKIEPGETPEEALIREIREELDAEIEVREKIAQVEYDYPEFHLSMGCFRCALRGDHWTLLEHEGARWLRPEELESVEWLPADRSVIRELKDSAAETERHKETERRKEGIGRT